MASLNRKLSDIEGELLQLRAGLALEGDAGDPAAVLDAVLGLSARLQQAAEEFISDLERKPRGRPG